MTILKDCLNYKKEGIFRLRTISIFIDIIRAVNDERVDAVIGSTVIMDIDKRRFLMAEVDCVLVRVPFPMEIKDCDKAIHMGPLKETGDWIDWTEAGVLRQDKGINIDLYKVITGLAMDRRLTRNGIDSNSVVTLVGGGVAVV